MTIEIDFKAIEKINQRKSSNTILVGKTYELQKLSHLRELGRKNNLAFCFNTPANGCYEMRAIHKSVYERNACLYSRFFEV